MNSLRGLRNGVTVSTVSSPAASLFLDNKYTCSQWKCQGTWVLPSQTSVGCALSLKEDTALDQLQ